MNERTDKACNAHIPQRIAAAIGIGMFAATVAAPALAYVGPGAGLGVLGALLAVLTAVLATVVGLVVWPLRMAMRRRKGKTSAAEATASGPEEHPR
jgi:hypothetical protein